MLRPVADLIGSCRGDPAPPRQGGPGLWRRAAARRLSLATALALALGGAARGQGPPPDRLAPLWTMDRTVARAAYRLSLAGVGLCPRTAPQSGLLLHDLGQYGPRLAPLAAARGLTDEVTVEAVVPGSPAQAVGLAPGDVLLAIERTPLSLGGRGGLPALMDAKSRLDAALGAGSLHLTVRRDGQRREITLVGVTGCDVRVAVRPSGDLEAAAGDRTVDISTALVAATRSEDELATILGHEFGHTILRTRRLARGRPAEPRGLLGAGVQEEAAADEIGLYLMARAGYDPAQAPAFWRRISAEHPFRIRFTLNHPDSVARARALDRAAADIARLRASGLPLVPPELKEDTP